jgi:hypothetical protein
MRQGTRRGHPGEHLAVVAVDREGHGQDLPPPAEDREPVGASALVRGRLLDLAELRAVMPAAQWIRTLPIGEHGITAPTLWARLGDAPGRWVRCRRWGIERSRPGGGRGACWAGRSPRAYRGAAG